jgi:hypothetical protein
MKTRACEADYKDSQRMRAAFNSLEPYCCVFEGKIGAIEGVSECETGAAVRSRWFEAAGRTRCAPNRRHRKAAGAIALHMLHRRCNQGHQNDPFIRKELMRPVLFSSKLTSSERRVYKAATILFIAVFFAFMWPIYPIFNRIRPLILGMPASLFYLVFLLAVAFVAILALYRWEDRHGKLEDPPDPAGPPKPNVSPIAPIEGEPRRRRDAAGLDERPDGGS